MTPVDPLGPEVHLGACDACGASFVEPSTDICQICGASLRLLPMHQPAGFRTTYRTEDFDDDNDESPSAGAPTISVSGPPDREIAVEGARISSYDQAQLVQVNDNNGQLFPIARNNDGSYLVTDSTLFPDVKGWPPPGLTTVKEIAIGELRTTDVLTVGLETPHLPGGLVPYSSQLLPAGMAAYWSLAEVLRRRAKRLLDIDPQELEFGLHPTSRRLHDRLHGRLTRQRRRLCRRAREAGQLPRAAQYDTGGADQRLERQAACVVLIIVPGLPALL